MTRPTSVALLITELNVGGAERALTNLAVGLDPDEFQVQVVSLGPRPEPNRAALVSEIEQAGIPVHFLDARSAWQAPGIVRRLKQRLHDEQPDVVLSFLYHANVIGGLAIRWLKHRPAHIAAVRVAEPNGLRLRIERSFLRRAASVTCVSESLADYVARRQGVPRKDIVVIPNGIDALRFDGIEPADLGSLGIEPERKLLTVVSRLEPQKGLDWLLSDIDQLLEERPNHDLLIVGEGSQRRHLESLIGNAKHSPRIHFAGQRNDVPAILRRSQMLLLPSRYEGMPNVVMEAMAASLPVVATNSEGVEELLGEGNQQIVAQGDVASFYDRVKGILQDDAKATEIGYLNRQRVIDCFPISRVIDNYATLIRRYAASR